MLQLFWLLPLATLFQEICALRKKSEKKKEREKEYKEIKRGKCPEPRRKEKSKTRGKNGQVSDSRIRGTRYPPERKEKENIEHLIIPKKLQSARKVCIPLKEQK